MVCREILQQVHIYPVETRLVRALSLIALLLAGCLSSTEDPASEQPPVAVYQQGRPYHYRAIVVSVYDGDTVTVDIDLGLDVQMSDVKVRLLGIDAPEVTGNTREAGLKTRDWLAKQCLGKIIILETPLDSREKYGRLLGELWTEEEVSLNQQMINLGLAIPYP